MVNYNSSRTFFGPDFQAIDNQASRAYDIGSKGLPNDRCRDIYKYQICENYFRKCSSTIGGLAMSPCPNTCEVVHKMSNSDYIRNLLKLAVLHLQTCVVDLSMVPLMIVIPSRC